MVRQAHRDLVLRVRLSGFDKLSHHIVIIFCCKEIINCTLLVVLKLNGD